MKKIILLAAVAAATMTSCSNAAKQETTEEKPKVLILFYSQTGATRTVANTFQAKLGADIEEIVPEVPYDGDFQATIQRCQQDKAEGKIPAIKPISSNLAEYDIIFLGYPVWFGTYAPPVESFVKKADLNGKRIITFCTFGSGGLKSSTENLMKELPESVVEMGYGVRNARLDAAPDEIDNFLKASGFIEGEAEMQPELSAPEPVTDADRAIYDAACGDYPMLHATPTMVSKASTQTKNYYMFVAEENGQQLQIRVQAGTEEGAKPEFTEVIR